MLVTILTACYNAEKSIAKTIEAILNQSYDDIEYIVLDGGSNDDTIKIINSYKDRYYNRFHRDLRFYSKFDAGLYDALNEGAKLANGELIGQINAGDYYENRAVEIMVQKYQKDRYDAAWGNIYLRRNNTKSILKKAHIRKIWTSSGWCHPACFSKREILLKNPYPLDSIHADFDYITNLYIHKKKLETVDEVIANFDFNDGGLSTKKGIKEAIIRANKTYSMYKKYKMSKFYYLYRLMYELVKCVCIGKGENMANNEEPRITIITVCRNEADHISFTLDSILRQNPELYELIILDGKSDDGTIDVIKAYENKFRDNNIQYTFISEKDNGIYNVMNKGIKIAKNDYCIFMNGGDGFYDSDIVLKAINEIKKKEPDVLYGDCYRFDEENDTYEIRISDYKAISRDCTIAHQSTFIKTSLLKQRGYDESYRCAADYEYWLYLLGKDARFVHFNQIVSYFRVGGLSTTSYLKSKAEVDKLHKEYETIIKSKTSFARNRIFDFRNNALFLNCLSGFSGPEKSGTWMEGNDSVLYVYLKNRNYHFVLKSPCFVNYQNKIYMNNQYLCDINIENNTFECVLKKEYIENGFNTFSIRTNSKISCFSEADPRKLTIHAEKMMFLDSFSYFFYHAFQKKLKNLFQKRKMRWKNENRN